MIILRNERRKILGWRTKEEKEKEKQEQEEQNPDLDPKPSNPLTCLAFLSNSKDSILELFSFASFNISKSCVFANLKKNVLAIFYCNFWGCEHSCIDGGETLRDRGVLDDKVRDDRGFVLLGLVEKDRLFKF